MDTANSYNATRFKICIGAPAGLGLAVLSHGFGPSCSVHYFYRYVSRALLLDTALLSFLLRIYIPPCGVFKTARARPIQRRSNQPSPRVTHTCRMTRNPRCCCYYLGRKKADSFQALEVITNRYRVQIASPQTRTELAKTPRAGLERIQPRSPPIQFSCVDFHVIVADVAHAMWTRGCVRTAGTAWKSVGD